MSGKRPRGGGKGGKNAGNAAGARGGAGGSGSPMSLSAGDTSSAQASAQLTATEDKIVTSQQANNTRSLKLQPPGRPAFGFQGRPSTVKTNHAEINMRRNLQVRLCAIIISEVADPNRPKEAADRPLRTNEYLTNPDAQDLPGLPRRTQKEIVQKLVAKFQADPAKNKTQPWRSSIITDFSALLYYPFIKNQDLDDAEQTCQISLGMRSYKVSVKPVKTLHMQLFFDYLSDFLPLNAELKGEYAQMLNVWLHYRANEDTTKIVVSSKVFPLHANETWPKWDLTGGLTATRGIFASIRPTTDRVLVNMRVAHGTFFTPQELPKLIKDYGSNMYKKERRLKLLKVRCTHLKDHMQNDKTIVGLARPPREDNNPNHTASYKIRPGIPIGAGPSDIRFVLRQKGKDDREITVSQYFKERYNVTVDPKLPVINCGSVAKPTFFPADVLEVKEGQFARMELQPGQMARMSKFAQKKPGETLPFLELGRDLLNRNRGRDQLGSDSFGTIGDLVNVPARFLATIRVNYGGKPSNGLQSSKPTWDLQGNTKMSEAAPNMKQWAIVFITTPTTKDGSGSCKGPDDPKWLGLRNAFVTQLKALNVLAHDSKPGYALWNLKSVDDAEGLQRNLSEQAKLGRHLVVCLFDDSATLFEHIKYYGDIVCGVPTTCVQASKWFGSNPQYVANVALKVNLRGGGVNQRLPGGATAGAPTSRPGQKMGGVQLPKKVGPGVSLPVRGKGPSQGVSSSSSASPAARTDNNFANEFFFRTAFKGESSMLVGVDVTHPAPSDQDLTPSVAGMVASVDEKLGQWPGVLRVQKGTVEMVAELGRMLMTRLAVWYAKNGGLPKNILIYRDGVSEGQYQHVLDLELPKLQEACAHAGASRGVKDYKPRITIVIAGKRHHTRFYPLAGNSQDGDADGNTRGGLVVDRGITETRNWEFYLQAHAAIIGTVRPVHYYVVYDEIFTHHHKDAEAANQLEFVTHQLSYLFGRATLAVSLCTPVYYAHLACERARVYLKSVDRDYRDGITPEALDQMRKAVDLKGIMRDVMFYI